MTAASNSSVLIALSSLGKLALVQERFPSGILIPNAVWREVVEEGASRPGAREVAEAEWIKVQDVAKDGALPLLLADLDEGEAEAILLAVQIGAETILLDERVARATARKLGLAVLGTVGILLWAKRTGRIPDLRAALEALQSEARFHLDASLVARAVKESGE